LPGKIGPKATVFLKKRFSFSQRVRKKKTFITVSLSRQKKLQRDRKTDCGKKKGKLERLLVKIPSGLNPGTYLRLTEQGKERG
jgi:hypothetical protein